MSQRSLLAGYCDNCISATSLRMLWTRDDSRVGRSEGGGRSGRCPRRSARVAALKSLADMSSSWMAVLSSGGGAPDLPMGKRWSVPMIPALASRASFFLHTRIPSRPHLHKGRPATTLTPPAFCQHARRTANAWTMPTSWMLPSSTNPCRWVDPSAQRHQKRRERGQQRVALEQPTSAQGNPHPTAASQHSTHPKELRI